MLRRSNVPAASEKRSTSSIGASRPYVGASLPAAAPERPCGGEAPASSANGRASARNDRRLISLQSEGQPHAEAEAPRRLEKKRGAVPAVQRGAGARTARKASRTAREAGIGGNGVGGPVERDPRPLVPEEPVEGPERRELPFEGTRPAVPLRLLHHAVA